MSQPIPNIKSLINSETEKTNTILGKCANFFPAIIFNYSLETQEVTCMNNKLQEYLGFSVEEFENLHYGLRGLIMEDDTALVQDAVDKFTTLPIGQSLSFLARFNHKNGGCRYLRSTCSRADAETVILMSQDVTDQIRLEDDAAATRQLFDETEKLIMFGTWSWSPKLDKMDWTEGMFELLGYEPEAVNEITPQFYIKHLLPEHAEQYQNLFKAAVNEKSVFEMEYVIRTTAGKEKYVLTKARPHFDKEGNVRKYVGITRDITTKKNYEKERDRSIRELNRSNKELEEFAYVASHDLHEPLRKVLTFSERLKGRFGEALGDDGRIYLDRIWASADSMRNLIDNLLEFSKITRGTRCFVACDLNNVVKDVLTDQELRIEETSTVLNIKNLPVVEAVPLELKQLFNNLIGNALKFRKKDEQPVINIFCKKLSHKEKSDLLLPFNQVFYQVDVQDNGIGFESVYAEKIFEIFQRLHGKAEYSGSGIGLAICKKIADNHDGLIYATSEPGIGSTFSVILPEKQH
jgi:PAS domain S-box-containing protein